MRRLVVLAAIVAALSACSSRALRSSEDLWEGRGNPDGAAFLGAHGDVERDSD